MRVKGYLFKSRFKAYFFLILGFVILIIDLIFGIFKVNLGKFSFSLAYLVIIYGFLRFLAYLTIQKQLKLTTSEIMLYGDKLERNSQYIMDEIGKGISVRDIALNLEKKEKIPFEVTCKFIIAIGKELLKKKN